MSRHVILTYRPIPTPTSGLMSIGLSVLEDKIKYGKENGKIEGILG